MKTKRFPRQEAEKARLRPELKDPRRQQRCDQSASHDLKKSVPGPRGACSPESATQGSE